MYKCADDAYTAHWCIKFLPLNYFINKENWLIGIYMTSQF